MIGRFSLSLYVGRMTEYLSFDIFATIINLINLSVLIPNSTTIIGYDISYFKEIK
jgi:hypothetical protein